MCLDNPQCVLETPLLSIQVFFWSLGFSKTKELLEENGNAVGSFAVGITPGFVHSEAYSDVL